MPMVFRVITQPALEPITLEEAKAHLRVEHTADDDLIGALITAARELAEGYQGRALIDQTIEFYLDEFPAESTTTRPVGPETAYAQPAATVRAEIELPHPASSVTHIKYYDTDGTEQTLNSALYQTDLVSEPARINPAYGESWPATRQSRMNAVKVTYVAGYGDEASDVPAITRSAIKLLVGHLYEHREAASDADIRDIPWGITTLLNRHRIKTFR